MVCYPTPQRRTSSRVLVVNVLAAACIGVCCAGTDVRAADGAWINPTGGNWADGANWSSNPLFPDGGNDVATFGNSITGAAVINIDRTIRLDSLRFDRTVSGGLTLTGPGGLQLNDLLEATGNGNGGHTIAVPIVAPTDLTISNRSNRVLAIDGELSGAGGITLRGPGTIRLNAANTYAGNTVLESAIVTAAAGALSRGGLDVGPAVLTLTGDQHVSSLRVNGGSIGGSGVLTVDATDIDLYQGGLEVPLAGIGKVLHKRGAGNAGLYLPGAGAHAVVVHGGRLMVSNFFNPTTTITVAAPTNALVHVPANLDNEVYLNNASGRAFGGALMGSDLSTLTGRVDLGDRGSYVAGPSNGRMTLAGPVTGGALNVVGPDTVVLTNGANTYAGPTVVGSGVDSSTLSLRGEGRIIHSPHVTVNDRATLRLDNVGDETASSDRVADQTPIALYGGNFSVLTSRNANSRETVGAVTAGAGASTIETRPDTNASTAPLLTIARLDREVGATLDFLSEGRHLGDPETQAPRVFITAPPALQSGIIGGWATVGGEDFATYDTQRGVHVLPVAGRPTQLHAAGPGDNVMLAESPQPLTGDRTVNSVVWNLIGDPPIDLGGHTLNIVSGGLLRTPDTAAQVMNGRVTAGGTSGGAELFITTARGATTIAADIVDNPGGAVGLTKSGGGKLLLSGSNTYTGPTRVNRGAIDVLGPSSAPADNDLVVQGGAFQIMYASEQPILLRSLALKHGAVSEIDNGAPLDAGTYLLENGALNARLAGAGQMTKATRGTVELRGDNSRYTGPIVVEQGILRPYDGTKPLGTGTVRVEAGGVLENHTSDIVNPIVLNGGELTVELGDRSFSGPIRVTQDSIVSASDRAETLSLSGPLALDGGKTLTLHTIGTIVVSGPQDHAPQSTIEVAEGRVSLQSDLGSPASSAPPMARLAVARDGRVTMVARQHLAHLSIQGGRASVDDAAAAAGPIVLGGLNLAEEGTLDIDEGSVVVHASPATGREVLEQIEQWVRTARDHSGKRWGGNGITSTAAAANPLTGLAIFSGNPDPMSILIQYAYNGDANGDGRVNADDYFRIDSGFLAQPADPTYADGDFNYDSKINADDYFLIDSAFLGQSGSLGTASLSVVAVPEPAACLLLAVGLGAAHRSSRRRPARLA
jgi:autotransporter-associated beta strand protein